MVICCMYYQWRLLHGKPAHTIFVHELSSIGKQTSEFSDAKQWVNKNNCTKHFPCYLWINLSTYEINHIYYILNFKSYNSATISVGKIHWFEGCSYPRRGQASSTKNEKKCLNFLWMLLNWNVIWYRMKKVLSYSLLGWKTSSKLCMEIQICK